MGTLWTMQKFIALKEDKKKIKKSAVIANQKEH